MESKVTQGAALTTRATPVAIVAFTASFAGTARLEQMAHTLRITRMVQTVETAQLVQMALVLPIVYTSCAARTKQKR